MAADAEAEQPRRKLTTTTATPSFTTTTLYHCAACRFIAAIRVSCIDSSCGVRCDCAVSRCKCPDGVPASCCPRHKDKDEEDPPMKPCTCYTAPSCECPYHKLNEEGRKELARRLEWW
jgi:hypothetical protein